VARDRFEIYAMRTFALTVWDWLADAALEFGYEVVTS
jgi:sarcosine oxidase gamma subunit